MRVSNEPVKEDELPECPSRRRFLGTVGKAGLGAAAISAAVPLLDEHSSAVAERSRGGSAYLDQRALAAYKFRVDCAQTNLQAGQQAVRNNNGDEALYPNRIGNYSKGLIHQSNGEVDLAAYSSMLAALKTGNPSDYESISMGGPTKLTNPQSGLAFDLEGRDAFSFAIPPPPAFASREIAAEIAENYWMAILRDVPYNEYLANPAAAAAAEDLSSFGSDFKGAKDFNGKVTPKVLFRGLTAGDKVGPYVSQFFYQTCKFGANEISQKIRTMAGLADGGANYLTDFGSWLAIQNGAAPTSGDIFDDTLRYIRNGRDMGGGTCRCFIPGIYASIPRDIRFRCSG